MFCSFSFSQTIYTPKGTAVSVSIQSENTYDERELQDSVRQASFPNVDFLPTYEDPDYKHYPIPSSSSQFNCHGYAWAMCEGDYDNHTLNDPYVMARSDADNYFQDGSFVTCSESEADVAWYSTGDHTALTTNEIDYLQSKWDDGPLAYHLKDDSPYTYENIVFYKRCYFYEELINYSGTESDEYCSADIGEIVISASSNVTIEFEKWITFEKNVSIGAGTTLLINKK